jgi:hypothetical protein
VKEGSYARERAVKPFGRNVVIKVVISDGPRVGCRRGRGEIGSLRRPPSAKGRQGKRSGGLREKVIFSWASLRLLTLREEVFLNLC